MAITIIPSVNWPERSNALTGAEHLLRQNPVGDASDNVKEERIPVSLILAYVLQNLPATSSGPNIYEDSDTIPENRAVTLDDGVILDFDLSDNSIFRIQAGTSNTVGIIVRENIESIEFRSGNLTSNYGDQGFYYNNFALTQLVTNGQYTPNSLVHKGYVDGISLTDNGDETYTFTNAAGVDTVIQSGSGAPTYTGETITATGDNASNVQVVTRATGLGITATHSDTDGILNVIVPDGIDVKSLKIFYYAPLNPALPRSVANDDSFTVNIDFQGARSFNTSIQTANIPNTKLYSVPDTNPFTTNSSTLQKDIAGSPTYEFSQFSTNGIKIKSTQAAAFTGNMLVLEFFE